MLLLSEFSIHIFLSHASSGGEPLIGSEYGQGDGPTFLNNLNCDSESQRLLECTPLFFSSPCTNQDIAVRCNGKIFS